MHFLSGRTAAELAPFLLRLALGLIFLVHGLMKFLHMAESVATFTKIGIPLPGLAVPVIGGLETLGGIVLLLGFGRVTRLLALLLALEMLGALLFVKRSAGFVGGYEFELLLFAALLTLVLSGQGHPALVQERE